MTTAANILEAQACASSNCICTKAVQNGLGNTHCPAHKPDASPSLNVDTKDGKLVFKCHTGCTQAEVIAALKAIGLWGQKKGGSFEDRIDRTYDYVDEHGNLLYQTVRLHTPKAFVQRRPDINGGWIWKMEDVRRVLFLLPELKALAPGSLVVIVEGEKDVLKLRSEGFIATTNPMGAMKFKFIDPDPLFPHHVVVLVDRDEAGDKHGEQVAHLLHGRVASLKVIQLPGLGWKQTNGLDVSDWFAMGNTAADLMMIINEAAEWTPDTVKTTVTMTAVSAPTDTADDFRAYLPQHQYIYVPTRELWPAASVDSRIGAIPTGKQTAKGAIELVAASEWLDVNRPVHQMTWSPGEPLLIEGKLIDHGGWIRRRGVVTFNLYRPPTIEPGDAAQAGPWIEHVNTVYPGDAEHIVDWLAHRVQRPHDKINHALVLGGAQGIGKDTILEPVKHAVGPWNFHEVSPAHLLGRFNGFVKAVILRVSEARDMGDSDRLVFYEHMKAYTAAPPDVLRCDEKNLREYNVINVCGVILTTNHKSDGVYLPEDDRRHYVAWSELKRDDFAEDYWRELYQWYADGGHGHVAALLGVRDISLFDAKAPPVRTGAWWEIVSANRAPEDNDLSDALDRLDWPDAVTLAEVAGRADIEFRGWILDRRNSRFVPDRMERAGYVPVRNDGQADGRWKVGGKNVVIYARRDLSIRDRIGAAGKLAGHWAGTNESAKSVKSVISDPASRARPSPSINPVEVGSGTADSGSRTSRTSGTAVSGNGLSNSPGLSPCMTFNCFANAVGDDDNGRPACADHGGQAVTS